MVPYHSAIILYLKKYMKCRICFSNKYSIYSDIYGYSVGLKKDKNYEYLQKIVKYINKYLKELDIKTRPLKMEIYSQLFENNKKIGLGSSASILVLVIKSMLKLYNIKLSKKQIFKLATLINIKLGKKGSNGDIACIINEKNTFYTSYDFSKFLKFKKFKTEMDKDWKNLSIKSFDNKKYEFYYIWTEKEASTDKLIKNIDKVDNKNLYQEIIDEIENLTKESINNIDNEKIFLENINKNNDLLFRLSNILNNNIVTDDILNILKISEKYKNMYIKISGAGGGDCLLLSFLNSEENYLEFFEFSNELKSIGITKIEKI